MIASMMNNLGLDELLEDRVRPRTMIASMMNNLGLDELLEDRVRPRTMIASMMNNLGLDVSLSMSRMMNNLGLDTHSVINAHHTCPKPKANSHRVLLAWFAGTRGNFADIPRLE